MVIQFRMGKQILIDQFLLFKKRKDIEIKFRVVSTTGQEYQTKELNFSYLRNASLIYFYERLPKFKMVQNNIIEK